MKYLDEVGEDQVGSEDARLEIIVASPGAQAQGVVPDAALGHHREGGEARVEGGYIGLGFNGQGRIEPYLGPEGALVDRLYGKAETARAPSSAQR